MLADPRTPAATQRVETRPREGSIAMTRSMTKARTQRVSLPITGGCQCGNLRYQIVAAPLMIYACHCANCQRIAGSAFCLSATLLEDTLEYTAGTPSKIEWRSDAGNSRYGAFCGNCGCRIAHGQLPSNGILSLRAGTFDDTSWIVPSGHIWTRSAQPWFEFGADDVLCDVQPADYAPFIQRFQASVSFSGEPS